MTGDLDLPRCGEVQAHEDEVAPEVSADGGQVAEPIRNGAVPIAD